MNRFLLFIVAFIVIAHSSGSTSATSTGTSSASSVTTPVAPASTGSTSTSTGSSTPVTVTSTSTSGGASSTTGTSTAASGTTTGGSAATTATNVSPIFKYLGYQDSAPDCEMFSSQDCNGKIHDQKVCYWNHYSYKCEESDLNAGFAGMCMGKDATSCASAAVLGCVVISGTCVSSYAAYDSDVSQISMALGGGDMTSVLSPLNTGSMNKITSLPGTGPGMGLDPNLEYYFQPDESDVPWKIVNGVATPVLISGDYYEGDLIDGDQMIGLPKGFGPPAGAPGLPMDQFSQQQQMFQQQMAMQGMGGMAAMMGQQMPVGMMGGMMGGMFNSDNMEDYMGMMTNPYYKSLTSTHHKQAKPVFPTNKHKVEETQLGSTRFDIQDLALMMNQNLGGNANSLPVYNALGLSGIPGFTQSTGQVGCWIDHPETDYPIPCPDASGNVYTQTGESDFPIKVNTNTGTVSPYNALSFLMANNFQVPGQAPGQTTDLTGLQTGLSAVGANLGAQFTSFGAGMDLGDAAYIQAAKTGRVPLWQMQQNLDNVDTDMATMQYQMLINQKAAGLLNPSTAGAAAPATPAAPAPATPAAPAPAAPVAPAAPAAETGADAGALPSESTDAAPAAPATPVTPAATPAAPAASSPIGNILNYYVLDRIATDNVDDLSDLQGLVGQNTIMQALSGQGGMGMGGMGNLATLSLLDDMGDSPLNPFRLSNARQTTDSDSATDSDSPAAPATTDSDSATDSDSPAAAATTDSDSATDSDSPDATTADDSTDSGDSSDATAVTPAAATGSAPAPATAPVAAAPKFGWNNIWPNGEYDFSRIFGQIPGPGQYYAQSKEADFPTLQGPGAPPQPVQLNEMDFPVLWDPTTNTWSIVQKPDGDYPIATGTPPAALAGMNSLFPLTTNTNGGSPLFPAASPILGSDDVFPLFLQNDLGSDLFVFQGRAFTQPQSLTALNSLQSLITTNNFPTDVGSILSGGFDLEDLMELQASQAQMNAFNGVLNSMQSSLNGPSLGMYTKYGSSPLMKYTSMGMPKLEDTIFGEDGGVLPDGRGGFMLNPAKSKRDGPFLANARVNESQTQTARPLTENPWFWGFLITTVLSISGSIIACRPSKPLQLDDLLLDQRSQQV